MVIFTKCVILNFLGVSGEMFDNLTEGAHSISIQFTPTGSSQALNCLPLQNFTISSPSKLFDGMPNAYVEILLQCKCLVIQLQHEFSMCPMNFVNKLGIIFNSHICQ